MTEAIVCENGSRAFWKLKGGDDRKAVICRGMLTSGFLFWPNDVQVFCRSVSWVAPILSAFSSGKTKNGTLKLQWQLAIRFERFA